MVQSVVTQISVMQVGRHRVVRDLTVFLLRCANGLLVAYGCTQAILRPVETAAGNGKDDFFAGNSRAYFVQYFLYPMLVRYIARVAAVVVLVNSHHKYKIVHML